MRRLKEHYKKDFFKKNLIDIGLKEYDPAEVSIEEYDPSEVVIDSDDSETSSNENELPANITSRPGRAAVPDMNSAHQIRNDNNGISKLCAPCVGSKSTRVVKRDKTMTPTTDKLEEVHADLWGPHNPASQSGSVYAAILMYEHTRKTWTLYLRGKDDFEDAFQAWLPRVEVESGCSMKTLRADGGGEFISVRLRLFCKKRGIAIRYAAPYVHEENGLAERGWRIIVTMKDAMLIDSSLPNGFWAEAMETANYLRNNQNQEPRRGHPQRGLDRATPKPTTLSNFRKPSAV